MSNKLVIKHKGKIALSGNNNDKILFATISVWDNSWGPEPNFWYLDEYIGPATETMILSNIATASIWTPPFPYTANPNPIYWRNNFGSSLTTAFVVTKGYVQSFYSQPAYGYKGLTTSTGNDTMVQFSSIQTGTDGTTNTYDYSINMRYGTASALPYPYLMRKELTYKEYIGQEKAMLAVGEFNFTTATGSSLDFQLATQSFTTSNFSDFGGNGYAFGTSKSFWFVPNGGTQSTPGVNSKTPTLEVLIYFSSLSSVQRNSVSTYLRNKHNIY
jgi:hypothetical protein